MSKIKGCVYIASFQGLGLAVIGPTLHELALQTGSTTEKLSFLITVSFIGRMIGSVIAGSVAVQISDELQLAIWTLGAGLDMGLVPWCPDVVSLGLAIGMTGICNGGITVCKY